MGYLFAVLAAALFGLGASVQQRVAARAPDRDVLRPALLWYLVRQPLWLVGVATALVGNVFGGMALGANGIALVQPLLATKVVFALSISARWNRRRLHRREWLAATAMVLGLAAFVLAGRPTPGTRAVDGVHDGVRWAATAGAVLLSTMGLVAVARRLRPRGEAPVLGGGAGVVFALQSGLTSVAVSTLGDHGVEAMLLAWPVYGVAVTALVGTLLAQSAYKLAPLPASYPPLTAIEPLAGIALGLALLGGGLRLTPSALVVEVVGLTAMTVGGYVLASSPLVTGAHHVTGPPTADDATVEAHEEQRADPGRGDR